MSLFATIRSYADGLVHPSAQQDTLIRSEVVADKRALNQIMLNLLSNAVKFSNRGGKVTVSAKAAGGSIAVTVEDTGVGIGDDDLPRVGDPFFQARSSYNRRHDGTGLVKGLVALHGGRVDIDSRLGEGTRETFRLPIDCRNPLPVADKTVVELPAPRAAEERPEPLVKKSA